ncbi:hypothetical protein ES703_18630 [subsurface metagenome]
MLRLLLNEDLADSIKRGRPLSAKGGVWLRYPKDRTSLQPAKERSLYYNILF